MTTFFKAGCVAVICIICSVLLKKYNTVYALSAEIAGGTIILLILLPAFSSVGGLFKGYLSNLGDAGEYFAILAKACAVACISCVISSECRDTGNSALAHISELGGKICVVLTGMPLIKTVFSAVYSMLA